MTIRNIRKNLAGVEDLLQGLGTEEQVRGDVTYVIGKIDVPYAVDSVAKMQALDIAIWTRARVYSDTVTFIDYIYNSSATEGITPDAGGGYWVLANPGAAATAFINADTTPSVKAGFLFKTTGTTAITDFDEGFEGQEITVKATDSITVVGLAMVVNDVAKFIQIDSAWSHINK